MLPPAPRCADASLRPGSRPARQRRSCRVRSGAPGPALPTPRGRLGAGGRASPGFCCIVRNMERTVAPASALVGDSVGQSKRSAQRSARQARLGRKGVAPAVPGPRRRFHGAARLFVLSRRGSAPSVGRARGAGLGARFVGAHLAAAAIGCTWGSPPLCSQLLVNVKGRRSGTSPSPDPSRSPWSAVSPEL